MSCFIFVVTCGTEVLHQSGLEKCLQSMCHLQTQLKIYLLV